MANLWLLAAHRLHFLPINAPCHISRPKPLIFFLQFKLDLIDKKRLPLTLSSYARSRQKNRKHIPSWPDTVLKDASFVLDPSSQAPSVQKLLRVLSVCFKTVLNPFHGWIPPKGVECYPFGWLPASGEAGKCQNAVPLIYRKQGKMASYANSFSGCPDYHGGSLIMITGQ